MCKFCAEYKLQAAAHPDGCLVIVYTWQGCHCFQHVTHGNMAMLPPNIVWHPEHSTTRKHDEKPHYIAIPCTLVKVCSIQ